MEIDKIIQRKNSLIFQGRNSSFQRKNKDISFVSGFLVGILNCFYLKEMELGFSILEEKIFLFEIIQKDLVFDDIKNKKDLFLFHEKEKNFLNWENYEIKKYCSFLDLLKFKKINFHSEINRWKFKHEIILEPQSFKLIFEKYHLINKNSFLQNCYYESSKSVFYDLLEKEISLQKRISFFRNIFSSFGWGLPIINFSLNEIHIKFIKNPFFKNDLSCVAGMLTGILEIIFGSRLKLKFIEKSTIIYEKI